MRRTRSRLLVLALGAGLLSAAAPAAADQRSPLEQPDAVKQIRVKVDGRVALAELESKGFDFSGNLARVPDGLEVDAIVTQAQELALVASGAEVLEPGEEFRWGYTKSTGFKSSGLNAPAAAPVRPRPPDPKVRKARAPRLTTNGPGFP